MIKDRIIESLEYCRKNQKCSDCGNCEYGGRSFLTCERLADDILVLLKEQEPVKPTFKQDESGINCWCCGSCGAYMYHIYDGIDKAKEYSKYCRQCGKQVKWE